MAVDAGVLEAKHSFAKHPEMIADCDCAGDSDVWCVFGDYGEQEGSKNGARATRPTELQGDSETGIAAQPVVANSKETTEDATGILSLLLLCLVISTVPPL